MRDRKRSSGLVDAGIGGVAARPVAGVIDWLWDPMQASAALDRLFSMAVVWQTRLGGRVAVEAASRARLGALIAFVRTHSRFYGEAWRGVAQDPSLEDLPPVRRRDLMARFDDWVTDPAVTREAVEAFIADPTRVGERLLGRYVVWESSGTSGEPGLYVNDDGALAIYDALIDVQFGSAALASRAAWGMTRGGARAALVTAVEGHFAGIASWRRQSRALAWLARSFSVLTPMPELVAALNRFRPAFLASYPTMLELLAEERNAGRLRIRPSLLWSGGEGLARERRAEIEAAFGCPVQEEYGASEFLTIAFGCREGALHVNADWVLLEPVDRDFRPVPPGELSHTVLLTNLANRVQPVIRYDLGDSVALLPGRCRCGSDLPRIAVEGRRDDIPELRRRDGAQVRLAPLALATVVEEAIGRHRYQIVQDAADRLRLRLDPVEGAGEPARRAAERAGRSALRAYLALQGLPDARVTRDDRPPQRDVPSGKRRQVIVLSIGGGSPAAPRR